MQEQRLRFVEGSFDFRELVTLEDLEAAYRLRYEICVLKLKWIDGNPMTGHEIDEFDDASWHFGAFYRGELIGYVRLTPEAAIPGLMSRVHFAELWQRDPAYAPEQSADLSRLVVLGAYAEDVQQILRGLYRLAYAKARSNQPQLRYWYFVTSRRELRALRWRFHFPVRIIGRGVTSDGKTTYVASLDLKHSRFTVGLLTPWRLHYFERCTKLIEPTIKAYTRSHAPISERQTG